MSDAGEDNRVMMNGHRADMCPFRVDVTTMADPYGIHRWAHGRCKPSSAAHVEFEFTDKVRGHKHSVSGEVISVDVASSRQGDGKFVTVKLIGSHETQQVHDRPHFRLAEDRHGSRQECVCECRECFDKINDNCTCRECHCNAG